MEMRGFFETFRRCPLNEQLLAQMILLERLPKSHGAWQPAAADLKNALAGARGESRVLSLLRRELVLEGQPVILTDLHVPYGQGSAQIDLLVVHQSFICVLEVKNMKGDFYFDSSHHQFHRMVDRRMEGMKNPESQLHRAVTMPMK